MRGQAWLPHAVDVLAFAPMKCVAAGRRHSLALSQGGHVYSWGCGRLGALGHNDARDVRAPTQVASLADVAVTRLVAGDCWSACMTSGGDVWWWGRDVAVGDGMNHLAPVCATQLRALRVSKVVAGLHHGMLLTQRGSVFAFGSPACGALGLDTAPVAAPDHEWRGAGDSSSGGSTVVPLAPTILPLSSTLLQRAAEGGAAAKSGAASATTLNVAACGGSFTVVAAGLDPGDTHAPASVARGLGVVVAESGVPAVFRVKTFTAAHRERVCGGDAVYMTCGALDGSDVPQPEVQVFDHNTGVYTVRCVPM